MGVVHEIGWTRIGLEVLRDVSLKQARELAKVLATQICNTSVLWGGGCLTIMDEILLERLFVSL
ncbi:hypothetical protein [Bartonella grahamii]|uniref:hypothetical protein n=1 Tax=Bartonella grahamii TaxID=33045 RepID=UPI002E7C36FF|nr:hypothetical protein [Bartonella grahamii]